MNYYTYFLCDSGTPEVPFYIGKGCKGRIDQHEKDAAKGMQSRVCNRIRAIWSEGRQIIKRKVYETVNERRALSEEARYIGFWRTKTTLTNSVKPNPILFSSSRGTVDH